MRQRIRKESEKWLVGNSRKERRKDINPDREVDIRKGLEEGLQ